MRNNYVYFINRKFYSFITHNYARDFDEKLTDIKDAYLSKKYSIDMYSILYWDEVALSDHKSTNFQNYASNDGGSDAYLRLIRQIGKETQHVIKTVQCIDRVVKVERELLTSIISIESREEIIISKFFYTILNLCKKLLIKYKDFINNKLSLIKSMKLRSWKKRINEKIANFNPDNPDQEVVDFYNKLKERYDLKSSKVRKLLHKIQVKIDKIYASSVLLYQGTLYTNADDVNKVNVPSNKKIKFKLTFPIRFCYGSSDTFAYSIVGDFLQLRSIDYSNYVEDTCDYPETARTNREVFVTKILTKDSYKNELNKKIRKDRIENLNTTSTNKEIESLPDSIETTALR